VIGGRVDLRAVDADGESAGCQRNREGGTGGFVQGNRTDPLVVRTSLGDSLAESRNLIDRAEQVHQARNSPGTLESLRAEAGLFDHLGQLVED
jgi:hypothetical protein